MADIFYQTFFKEDKNYSVVIEDNGQVAYAYLLKDGNIVSDVWLYNQIKTPEISDWPNKESLPFLNSKEYTFNDGFIRSIQSREDFEVIWENIAEQIIVRIIILGKIKVQMDSNEKIGLSNNIFKTGPLARKFSEYQRLNFILNQRLEKLTGEILTPEKESILNDKNSTFQASDYLVLLMRKFKLIGQKFSLKEKDDLSEIGVEMQWMSPEEQLEEAFDFYPGKVALKNGYLPIGKCLEGSGDPYFIKQNDSTLKIYRIPHDSITNDNELREEEIEIILDMSQFFELSELK